MSNDRDLVASERQERCLGVCLEWKVRKVWETERSPSHVQVKWGFYNQWGRRLEGWSNTAACLAGGRRVTQQGGDFVRDRRSMPPALKDHTTCPGLELIYYWMYTKHRHELRHARKAWSGTLVGPMPSLGYNRPWPTDRYTPPPPLS